MSRAPVGLLVHLAWSQLVESRATLAFLICAVAAGVGFQVPSSALMHGYRRELVREGVEQWLGDVRVRPRTGAVLGRLAASLDQIRGLECVTHAEPLLIFVGAAAVEQRQEATAIIGVHADAARPPFRFVRGEALRAGNDERALVGEKLAERLGIGVGDEVVLRVLMPPGPLDDPSHAYRNLAVRVSGIVAGSFGAHDAVFVDLASLTDAAGYDDSASLVAVHACDHGRADELAGRVETSLPAVTAQSFAHDSGYLESLIGAIASIRTVSSALVLAAVSIPVLALFFVRVRDQRRALAIIAAIGLEPVEVFVAVLLQALLVGLAGIALGLLLATALVAWFASYPIFEWHGFVVRPELRSSVILGPAVTVLAATLAAGVYPAWRAARVEATSILRGAE